MSPKDREFMLIWHPELTNRVKAWIFDEEEDNSQEDKMFRCLDI